jgi:hypothetical protein
MAALPPKGAFCSHARMRYVACVECKKRKIKCSVWCPDCGFTWMLGEGVLG